MQLLTIIEFIGRFHPAIVHLPIGILLTALLLQWFHAHNRYGVTARLVKLLLLCGMVSAFAACITGWLLSFSGGYEEDLVGWHMWMGIAVAFCSLLVFMKFARTENDLIYKSLSGGLLLLIGVTGHLGGSLTHGEDYLFAAFAPASDSAEAPPKAIPNIQEAVVYTDVIDPMLKSKCYSCHGATKQKGKLRLDDPQWLMKGGKDGPVIVPSAAIESELIKRLLLPAGDEHHMPPKDKPQLKERQVALLHWWVDAGADFTKKVREVPQPDNIKPYLLALQSDHMVTEKKTLPDIPVQDVEPADAKAIQALRGQGITVLPVSRNSNYLQINYITASNVRNKSLEGIAALKKQLVWLKLGNTPVGDSAMTLIAQCKALRVLQLNNTHITDAGLAQLGGLDSLVSLNLVGTDVSATGLLHLKSLSKLRSVYLYQTKVQQADWKRLQATFKATVLDSGGYSVPFLPTDTQVIKPVVLPK